MIHSNYHHRYNLPSWKTTILLILYLLICHCNAFSNNNKSKNNQAKKIIEEEPVDSTEKDNVSYLGSQLLSRRDAWRVLGITGGGIAYAKILGDTISKVITREINFTYPPEHESRVKRSITQALMNAVARKSDDGEFSLRILEVGMGEKCRLIRRGLYDEAFQSILRDKNIRKVELVGVDLKKPDDATIQKAKEYLSNIPSSPIVDLTFIEGDITTVATSMTSPPSNDSNNLLSSSSSLFDAVICCLTLCSVTDPTLAVTKIRDLLNPKGGCLAYVEHTAVDDDDLDDYRLLDWQQRQLDPFQQALAGNCHLHRPTQETIQAVFRIDEGGKPASHYLSQERFLVDSMWPVSYQSCGVIQRTEYE